MCWAKTRKKRAVTVASWSIQKICFYPYQWSPVGPIKCGVAEIMWALEAIVDAEEKWCEHMPLVTVLIWWHTGF
jgi:hypothetical protein